MDEFIFSLGQTGEVFIVRAEDSDKALILCLKETKWNLNQILYIGKTTDVEAQPYLGKKNAIHFIPGRNP